LALLDLPFNRTAEERESYVSAMSIRDDVEREQNGEIEEMTKNLDELLLGELI